MFHRIHRCLSLSVLLVVLFAACGGQRRLQYDANPTNVQNVVRQFFTDVGAGQWHDTSKLLTVLTEHEVMLNGYST
jgi:hypothetical protein